VHPRLHISLLAAGKLYDRKNRTCHFGLLSQLTHTLFNFLSDRGFHL